MARNKINSLGRIIAGTLLAGSLAGITGCEKLAEEPIEPGVEIKVSDSSRIGIYNGMIGRDTFSISCWGNNDAVNIFYPADSKEIYFNGDNYEVMVVNPERIILRKIKKK